MHPRQTHSTLLPLLCLNQQFCFHANRPNTREVILDPSLSPSSPSVKLAESKASSTSSVTLVEACFSFHIHHNSLLIAFTTFNPCLSFFHPLAKLFMSKYQSDHESPACHPNFTACFLEALLTPQENGM